MGAMGAALAEQYGRAWEMTRAIIGRFTPETWRSGLNRQAVAARWAYHLVETADFYLGDRPPEQFPWGQRFGCDWEGAEGPELPTQAQLLAYLDEVQATCADRLRDGSDEALLGGSRFPWTGPTLLDQMLYLLRHTQHHLGEMNMLLRLNGVAGDDWR